MNNENTEVTQLVYRWQRNTRWTTDRGTWSSIATSNTYTTSFFNINCHI